MHCTVYVRVRELTRLVSSCFKLSPRSPDRVESCHPSVYIHLLFLRLPYIYLTSSNLIVDTLTTPIIHCDYPHNHIIAHLGAYSKLSISLTLW